MAVDTDVLQKQTMVIPQCQPLPGVYREEVDRIHTAVPLSALPFLCQRAQGL